MLILNFLTNVAFFKKKSHKTYCGFCLMLSQEVDLKTEEISKAHEIQKEQYKKIIQEEM